MIWLSLDSEIYQNINKEAYLCFDKFHSLIQMLSFFIFIAKFFFSKATFVKFMTATVSEVKMSC